jgi:hypothetical protein
MNAKNFIAVLVALIIQWPSLLYAQSPSKKSASASKEQIYVYFVSEDNGVNISPMIKRASSYEAAQTGLSGNNVTVLRRLDSDKCKSGFYILGLNHNHNNGRKPIAGYLNCGYPSLADAIRKGTRDFPMPFFSVIIGAVSSKNGDEIQLGCGYNQNYERNNRKWIPGAAWGNSGVGGYGSYTNENSLCDSLNSIYPILVDREPEQTIWVTPR